MATAISTTAIATIAIPTTLVITGGGPLSSISAGPGYDYRFGPIVPLTTVFTPPPSCSTRHLTVIGLEGVNRSSEDRTAYWDAGFMFGGASGIVALDCYPSEFAQAIYSTAAVFSPGVCPSGYSTVSTWKHNSSVSYETTLSYTVSQPPPLFTGSFSSIFTDVTTEYSTVPGATVTAAACCLSSFLPDARFGCTSIMTTTTEALLLQDLRSPTSIVPLTATPITVVAPGIVAEWKAEDLSLFHSASSSAPSGRPTSTNIPSSSSPSSGAKAGVSVAAVVGFLLIISICFSQFA